VNVMMHEGTPHKLEEGAKSGLVPIVIGVAVLCVIVLGGFMMWRADARTNKVALGATAKPVTVVPAQASTFRPSRMYVGTLQPWVEANVGPQLVSAYADTVLVRPGSTVKRGEILATLDCRNASASQRAVASQARAIDARQRAVADESARTQGLLDGGFVSPNQAEQVAAQSASQEAELEATKAKLASTALEVNDCVLRSPFDGEISRRTVDPGGFVRPGTAIVSVVDRSTIRMAADAPESDFEIVRPGTKVMVRAFATGKEMQATITRRAPAADVATRTVHFEIDIPDPNHAIPVGTTGEVHIDVGEPVPASEIPVAAATIRGAKATVFVVDDKQIAHAKTVALKGETGGRLFLDSSLAPGSDVVTEGRALLSDGDKVAAKRIAADPAASSAPSPSPSSASAKDHP
jgi:RND family efflux transporter MFP subunit